MAQQSIVQFGDWISRGWELFRSNWKVWSLIGSLIFLSVVLMLLLTVVVLILMPLVNFSEPTAILLLLLILLLGTLGLFLWNGYISAIAYQTAFRQIKGEKINTVDFKLGDFQTTIRIAGATVLIILLTMIGLLMCILPAFIVAGLTYLTIPSIVRNQSGIFEALNRSFEITRSDWLMFTVFALVVSMIAQIGAYACYIGLIFTLPLMFTISAVAYIDCFEKINDIGPESESAAKVRFCRNCGKTLDSGTQYCHFCGSPQ